MIWCVQMQAGISHDRLLACIGMNSEGPTKWVLSDYFQRTKSRQKERSVSGFMELMDQRFRKSSEDLLLNKMTRWNELKRRKTENLRLFWMRLERMMGQLINMGAEWPDSLVFLKAYRALDLSADLKTMITAALEMTRAPQSLQELKRLTTKLLDVKTESYQEETFIAENSGDSETVGGEQEEDDLTMVLTKPRAVKSKPKAGNRERSVQSTKVSYGMNSSSYQSMECLRFGSKDHWWRNCPKPFDKSIVFPKPKTASKGGVIKGGKKCDPEGVEEGQ